MPGTAPSPKKERSKLKLYLIPAIVVLIGLIALFVKLKLSVSVPYAAYESDYASKPDFAEVEYKYPLSAQQLMTLTPENLKSLDQEKVDQIYARLTAGPIPDGPYNGDLFFPNGPTGMKRLGEIVGGIKGYGADLELAKLTVLGRALWKGKVFYRDQRVLRNRIDDLNAFKDFFPDPADQQELEAAKAHPTAENQYFPAKLYCGQSLIDSRRESVIIDYAFTDELPGYRKVPDKLAGREGLIVRDEIRMVRPGFYLGRAYMAGTFILNFTLYNKAVADQGSPAFLNGTRPAEDCWIGYQRMAANHE
ncbi:MAG TPA: hypothetical protein VKE71_14890 [Candidatus Angelobacter sp.]|nr:hypothetical protein [Candidatus Angelobacter sp.]